MTARRLLWTAVAAYAAGFGALSILRHRAFETGRFDLGNMVQAVWTTAHGDFLGITTLDGEQTLRFAAHFDPILVALAPLWWLWPRPELLLAVQALAIASGALPVFALARRRLGSDRAALGFSLAYLLYPATQWLTLNEFHPVALACPLLLFAWRYLDEDRLAPFAVAAALACTTKEQVGLVVAGMGIWYAVSRRRAIGLAIGAVGVTISAFAIGVVVPHYNAGAGSAFYGRYAEVGGSAAGILETAFRDPVRLLSVAFDERGLVYLAQLAVPLAGLFLLAPLVLVAAAPELAINLLSASPPQTSIHFHYTATLIPVLVVGSILGAQRVRRFAVGDAVVVVAVVSNFALGAIPAWSAFPLGEDLQARAWRGSAHDAAARAAVDLVPGGAVVSVSNSLGAHVSDRERVHSFPYLRDATWVLVDETSAGYADRIAPLPYATRIAALRRDSAWTLVYSRDGVLVFRKR